ncbi:MAG: hypothetical protein DRJ14_08655, partial [Acidobacteria bacterium]
VMFAGQAKADWSRYKPGKMADIIEAHKETAKGLKFLFTADSFPTLASVTYLGKIRNIPEQKMAFLDKYLVKTLRKPEWVKLFKREIQVREAKQVYWLPVQEPVLGFFPKEVKTGDVVNLYVIWAGGVRIDKKMVWIFLVNEFNTKSESDK